MQSTRRSVTTLRNEQQQQNNSGACSCREKIKEETLLRKPNKLKGMFRQIVFTKLY